MTASTALQNARANGATTPEIGRSMVLPDLVVNYHDVGPATAPPVLLIHGSGPGVTAWANWRLTIPDLARSWRVVAPDMAGFGYTEVAGGQVPDRAMWLRQLVGMLDALRIGRVSVIGNSFGGALALALASEYPQRVERLVLMGAVGLSFPLTEGLDKVWGYTPSPESMRGLLDVFVCDKSRLTDDLVDMRYRASLRPGVQERFAALFPPPRQRGIEMLALAPERVRHVWQPVLLLHGREDEVIPVAVSQRLHALLPHSRLQVVERCGHWVQIEHPETFTRAVTAFLRDGLNDLHAYPGP